MYKVSCDNSTELYALHEHQASHEAQAQPSIMTAFEDHNDWNASKSDLFLIGSLMLLSLMAAFDSTILIPTLPV